LKNSKTPGFEVKMKNRKSEGRKADEFRSGGQIWDELNQPADHKTGKISNIKVKKKYNLCKLYIT